MKEGLDGGVVLAASLAAHHCLDAGFTLHLLDLAVCQKGVSVGFTKAAALMHEVMAARDDRRPLGLRKQMAGNKRRNINELGFVTISKTGTERLFAITSQRCGHGATLITSNLRIDKAGGNLLV